MAARTALVTGAAQGLGEAIARALHARGSTVLLADLNLDGARSPSERRCHPLRSVPVQVGDDDRRAACVQAPGDRLAQALRRTGDDGGAPG